MDSHMTCTCKGKTSSIRSCLLNVPLLPSKKQKGTALRICVHSSPSWLETKDPVSNPFDQCVQLLCAYFPTKCSTQRAQLHRGASWCCSPPQPWSTTAGPLGPLGTRRSRAATPPESGPGPGTGFWNPVVKAGSKGLKNWTNWDVGELEILIYTVTWDEATWNLKKNNTIVDSFFVWVRVIKGFFSKTNNNKQRWSSKPPFDGVELLKSWPNSFGSHKRVADIWQTSPVEVLEFLV